MSVLCVTALILTVVVALPLNSPLLPSYDYIVVGGGPAGLTVANRLSEDPTVNVLLLEAGPPDAGEPEVNIPGLIGDDIGGIYDWNLSTVPQIYLDGAPRSIPQGRVLGGGTILNGMLWNRGGQGDYQDWISLGNPGWGWDDLLPYFMKSETYTPVYSQAIADEFSIEEYPAIHGVSGPVNVSFPKYFWNSSAVLFTALNEIGVPTAYDPNAGLIAGASFLPLDVNPVTEERSDARKAYYDPYIDRSNLWVSTGQLVTQIIFDGQPLNTYASNSTNEGSTNGQGESPGIGGGIFGATTTLNITNATDLDESTASKNLFASYLKRSVSPWLWDKVTRSVARHEPSPPLRLGTRQASSLVAVGVEYAADSAGTSKTVAATREVIIAAGAIHSPQILMLSGIGPLPALEAVAIPVNLDLPGVGSNLQDHGRVFSWYPFNNASYSNPTELTSNDTFASEALEQYWANHTGPLTSAAVDGVAFPALPYIVNGSTIISTFAGSQAPQQYLPGDIDPTVLNGYAYQLPLMVNALQDVTRAAYEILSGNDGVLSVATMRPFSRGTVKLNSSSPFDPPLIDPRYGSNPVDIQVLEAALAFNQRLLFTDSLSQLNPIQIFPPPGAGDAEIVSYIQSKWQTEYHPAGTCPMMPFELGGVVSSELLVYGTQNLRVVDSSIMPTLPAAHLQAVVYGIAEKAADIIKAAHASGSLSSSATSAGLATSTTFLTVVYTQTVSAS